MRALLLFMAATTVFGQVLANPDRLPQQWKTFQKPAASAQKLRCRISPIKPRLNLSFHFQTGYAVEVPLQQYSGAGHWWSVVLRVTPESGERQPAWLVSRVRVPAVPETRMSAQLGGSYLVGEGKYRVDMLVVDDKQRVCVGGWNMRAKLTDEVRERRYLAPKVAPQADGSERESVQRRCAAARRLHCAESRAAA
jgi:hypothetical protein